MGYFSRKKNEKFDDFLKKLIFSKVNFFQKFIKIFDFSIFSTLFLKLFSTRICFRMGFLKSSSRDLGESVGSGFRACPTTYTLQFARTEKTQKLGFWAKSQSDARLPTAYRRPGFSGNVADFYDVFVSRMLNLRASERLEDSVFLDQRYRMHSQPFWR